jgi:hypothetical protein
MAGDWIKMRTDLYRDPKVCVMADVLMRQSSELAGFVNQNEQRDMCVTRNVMRNATVGALVSVWGVLRLRGKRIDSDLIVSGTTLAVIDDVSDLPGFGSAMAHVGWAVETAQGVVFPRFFEDYNVDPASDAKAQNAERQRRFREKNKADSNAFRNVTVTPKRNARVEKSREEKIVIGTNVPITYSEGFEAFWKSYPRRQGNPPQGKANAFTYWQKIPSEDLPQVMLALSHYSKTCNGYPKDPERFLKKDFWKDHLAPPAFTATTNGTRSRNGAGQLFDPSTIERDYA